MILKKGTQVKVITGKDKGKTGEILEINRKLNTVKIKSINMIKKHLKPTKENKGGIISKENFIHQSNVKNIDLTLSWLLDVYSSNKIISNHQYFISQSKFRPKIKNGTYDAPSSHRILVKGKLVQKINQLHEKCDTTSKSWIVFDANRLNNARQITEYELNPSWPQFIDSAGSIEIYKTGHSVFIETDSNHQVLFASDGVLFQNLQKLNWESIQQVGIYKNYYLILTQPYPGIENKLFIVDNEKGLVLEFRKDVLLDFKNHYLNIESFEVMEDELFLFIRKSPNFDYKIKEKSISLILIENSLKNLELK